MWRESGKNVAFDPKYTIPTIKHPKSLMVWGCITADGVGRLVRIEGTMDRFKYVDILQNNLKASAKELKLGRSWTFQQDSDPKVLNL